jgi:hypothetical protein
MLLELLELGVKTKLGGSKAGREPPREEGTSFWLFPLSQGRRAIEYCYFTGKEGATGLSRQVEADVIAMS